MVEIRDEIPDAPACPLLGLAADRETHFTFPHAGHRCYATGTPATIDLAHQAGYCLTAGFASCPRYAARVAPDAPSRIGRPLSRSLRDAEAAAAIEAIDEEFAPEGAARPAWISRPASEAQTSPQDAVHAEVPSPDRAAEDETVPPGAREVGYQVRPRAWPSPEAASGPDATDPRGAPGPAPSTQRVAADRTTARPGLGAAGPLLTRIIAAVALLVLLFLIGFAGAALISHIGAGGDNTPGGSRALAGAQASDSVSGAADAQSPADLATSSPTASPRAGAATDSVASATGQATSVPVRPTTSPPFPGAAASPRATSIVYVVKVGDTINRIAAEYGIAAQQIISANRLKDPNLIVPGQRLIIPPP